jgi:hypothetical protein
MLSYLLLITIVSLVVAFVLATFPRIGLVRVPVSQRKREYPEDSRLPPSC